jgi:hypothetical protein
MTRAPAARLLRGPCDLTAERDRPGSDALPRPMLPSPSVVVAFTDTASTSSSERLGEPARIAATVRAMRGRAATTVTSTFPVASPAAIDLADDRFEHRHRVRPGERGSSTPKRSPMSPSPPPEQRVDDACATTSASE